MPSDDLPDTMIINNHVSPQYTDNNNNQTITPKGSMSGNITIGRGYAELPSHFHEITEHYSFFPGTKWESISEKELSSNFFHAYGGLGGSTKYTSYAGDPNNPGHTHTFKSGKTELPVQSNNTTLTLNNIPINIEKPALTVYCWVRVE